MNGSDHEMCYQQITESIFSVFWGYRNNKMDGLDMSPARLFLGRRLKSILPTTVLLLKSGVEDNTLVKTKC